MFVASVTSTHYPHRIMASQAVLVSLLLLIPVAQSTTTTASTTLFTGNTTIAMGSTAMSMNTTASSVNTTASSVSMMNITGNFSSTPGNTTTAMSTTPTTTATTTTAKPMPDIPHGTEIAWYVLSLAVSNDNTSDIRYLNANLTRNEILSKISMYFRNISFSTDLVMMNVSQMPAMYTLKVLFLSKNIVNNSQIQDQIRLALANLTTTGEFTLPNSSLTMARISQFLNTTMDPCAAMNVCPVGYYCISDGCRNMCSDKGCSSHGMCYISVMANGTATPMCQCDSEYATEYMGDNCEYSRRGRLQIIAIIAGVLGAACLIFIIVIIVLCLKYNRTSSSSNYNVSTANYGNNAYDEAQQK